jgi:hypothetical protein
LKFNSKKSNSTFSSFVQTISKKINFDYLSFPLHSTLEPMCDFFIQLEAAEEKAAMEEEDLRHKLNARLIEHLKGALPSLKVLQINYTSTYLIQLHLVDFLGDLNA